VAWSPTGEANSAGAGREATEHLTFPGKVVKAERMPLSQGLAERVADTVNLKVTESPVYIWLKTDEAK